MTTTPTPTPILPRVGSMVAYRDSEGLVCPAMVLATAGTLAEAPADVQVHLRPLQAGELTLMIFSPKSDRPYRRQGIPELAEAEEGRHCWWPMTDDL